MSELMPLVLAHMRLVVIAVGCACLIGLPLGVLAARRSALGRVALSLASLIQTIPGLALLAVMVPALAWLDDVTPFRVPAIGMLPALLALTLYALLPIVRGAVIGIGGIDASVIEAAQAVGMTSSQRLRQVELPLAAPSIVAGLRTATVWTVGMATLGTPVGATSLGDLVFAGLQTRAYGNVLLGCAAAATLAIVLDALLAVLAIGLADPRARWKRRVPAILLFIAVPLVLVPMGSSTRPIRIGAKSFTEQLVLAERIATVVEPFGPIERHPSLGTTVAFDALRAGDLDVYVEYSGTAWTTILHEDGGASRERIRREVGPRLAREHDVHVVCELGFENAYALVVRRTERAQRISDLGTASALRFGGDYEFFARSEWTSLVARYGLAPRQRRTMDPSLLYQALAAGELDVISGFTTDGRIEALHLRALADDRGAIPPYDAIVLVSGQLLRERPEVVRALRSLAGSIDAEHMRAMNAAVDSGGRAPADAARMGLR